MNTADNSFLVKYFDGEKLLLDISVSHWSEYVTALKASNKVTIDGQAYNIENINMVHNTDGKGLVIELLVALKAVKIHSNKLVTGKRLTK